MLAHTARLAAVPVAMYATRAQCESLDTSKIDPVVYEVAPRKLSPEVKICKLLTLSDFGIKSASLPNPNGPPGRAIKDGDCVLVDVVRKASTVSDTITAYPRAGPRAVTHFVPGEVRAGIVTCGGLCPGLNDVVRNLVETLHASYGAEAVIGIRGGYRGFHSTADAVGSGGGSGGGGGGSEQQQQQPRSLVERIVGAVFGNAAAKGSGGGGGGGGGGGEYDPYAPMLLTPALVEGWHKQGGTNLGSARGGFDEAAMLRFIQRHRLNQLYVIGGDGTHRGAYRLAKAVGEKKLNVAVCGVPKTIDNDIGLIDYSFGFGSAVQAAQVALQTAETEAKGNRPNGIGVVKLMGRSSGYIAAYSCISHGSVDLCLVPEVPVVLTGPNGCLPHLERVVATKGHAVVVVAEGAGEEMLGASAETDAGGNKKLPPVGAFLVDQINAHFAASGKEATVKYIDPSYTIRSVPATTSDAYYCQTLAAGAVHGVMAGYTGFSVGMVNNHSVLIPIPALVAASPRTMDKNGRTWDRVLAVTGQPNTAH